MKIGIASAGENEKSDISPVAGRAEYYLIFEDKKLVKKIKNPFRIGGGGAGFGVVQMLADEKVDLVIAGRFGQNMVYALDQKKIKHKEMSGVSAEDALDKI